jgi:TatD DNase family protein
MFIDSHAHLSSEELFPHFKDLHTRAKDAKIDAIVNICTDSLTLKRGLQLKQQYPDIFLAASSTPHDSEEEALSFFPEVVEAAKNGQLIAIGETGLDYYYEHAPKNQQEKRMISYFELAIQTNLPIIFHCREAFADLLLVADRQYTNRAALLHCFTGTLDEAKAVLDRGWYISISGIVTFAKSIALQEVARFVPLDRLMIETDAPYLAPRSKRGKVNEPSFICETAQMIADLKGISIEEVGLATKENAARFFGI